MNISRTTVALTVSTIWFCLFPSALIAEIRYVDQRAIGTKNGVTWHQAYTDLQQALAVAQAGDEIRIATGIYTPAPPNGDPNATFQLVSGVTVRGGYAGVGAPDPDVWDIQQYPTVLSGDLNGDDGPDWGQRADNAFTVVVAIDTDANTVLDGVTISDGHAFYRNIDYMSWLKPNYVSLSMKTLWPISTEVTMHGCFPISETCDDEQSLNVPSSDRKGYSGGLYLAELSTITLKNCLFKDNTSMVGGAAMCIRNSGAQVHHCTFTHNYVVAGSGGIGCSYGTGTDTRPYLETLLFDCDFYHNASLGKGNAIQTHDGKLIASRCRFQNNSKPTSHPDSCSVLYNFMADILLMNCIFSGNQGGTLHTYSGKLDIVNCTLVGNHVPANRKTPAIYSSKTDLSITNSIIWGNTNEPNPLHPEPYYQIRHRGDEGTFHLDHSLIESWETTEQTGDMYPDPLVRDPLFVDADGPDDIFGTPDDNFRLLPGSPCIDSGWNETEPNLPDRDMDGQTRIVNGSMDMGAYEFEGIIYVGRPAPAPTRSRSTEDETLYYHSTHAYHFATIQDAIDTAHHGHTVIVAPGTYNTGHDEILEIKGKNITLRSTNPTDPVTANQTILGQSVLFDGSEDANCVLTGFRLSDPTAGTIYGNNTGAMLSHCYLVGNGPCDGSVLVKFDGRVQNCLIADNSAGADCGMYPVIYGCSAAFTNCTVANNQTGIHVNNASFENCILYYNHDPNIFVSGRNGHPGSLKITYSNVEGMSLSRRSRGGSGSISQKSVVNTSGDSTWHADSKVWGDPQFVAIGMLEGWQAQSSHTSWYYEFVEGDYHLKTPGWRWTPISVHGFNWVYDAISDPSPCIDAGNPDSDWGEELLTVPHDPEGQYGINTLINLGVYGGTWQASLAPPKPTRGR